MNRPLAGFRLRLAAVVFGGALVALIPADVATLLRVRDELVRRRLGDAREQLDRTRARVQACAGDAACEDRALHAAGVVRVPRCEPEPVRRGRAQVCAAGPGEASFALEVELAPVQLQLREAQLRLLGILSAGVLALAVLLTLLLERTVVRRVAEVGGQLERIGAGEERALLLREGGDALGWLGAEVNRLGHTLRDERARVRAQIVELESTNAALRTARRDLERSERLAGIGRLAAGVAHELGNPVAAVLGYASLLRAGLATEALPAYAGRLEREALRMDRILRDLLELARPQPLQVAPVELARVVESAWAHARPQIGELRLESELGATRALADEHALVQVFVNLFTNSARAGARGVRVSRSDAGEGVAVEIRDDGRGIAPELLPRLFEPFFTTAAPGRGSGLGLALCHASLERMGGSIAALAADAGAHFRVLLRAVR